MNDAFLYQYRQAPSLAFSQSLYKRISAEPRITITAQFSPLKQMARCLNIIAFGLAVAFSLSPDARASVCSHVLNARQSRL